MNKLTTERLTIRDHTLDDLQGFIQLHTDEEAMYFLQNLKSNDVEQLRKKLDEFIADALLPNRQRYFLCIQKNDTHEYVGEIGYSVLETTPIGKIVDVGYFMLQKYWYNGYATEALNEMIRFAFCENDVFRISAGCIKDNVGSEKVMQKCGMIKEAEFKCKQWLDGEMRDRVEYRLLRDEFDAFRATTI